MPWNAQDWYYRGEGNANIVFAHKTDNIVLRLAKCPVLAYDCIVSRATTIMPKQESSEFANSSYSNCDTERKRSDISKVTGSCFYQNDANNSDCEIKKDLEDIKASLRFARHVMSPFLGLHYVDAGRLVHVPKQFVCHIGELAKSDRPNNRLHKTVVPADQIGVIMPDFCQIAPICAGNSMPGDQLSTTVCVEIKPKQGFIESKFSAIQSTTCHFCMFQHVKLKKGTILGLSSYCPLDLFSGSYERTKLALTSLFASPQNNLRIFDNGNEVFGVSSDCNLEKFQFFLKRTLFHDFAVPIESSVSPLDRLNDLIMKVLWYNSCISKSDSAKLDPSAVNYTNKEQLKLPEGCVLERILKVQKLGDFNLSVLLQQYESLNALNKKPCHISGDYTSQCWQSLLQSEISDARDYLHILEVPESSCTSVMSCDNLKRYLVAKTAMDCTIMIALKPVHDCSNRLTDLSIEHKDNHVVMDICDNAFQFSVKIVDLDPKDCDKLEYYCKQEAEMLAVYAAASSSRDFIKKYCSP